MVRCRCIKNDGFRCTRNTKLGNDYCWQHQNCGTAGTKKMTKKRSSRPSRSSRSSRPSANSPKKNYFKGENNLSNKEKRYCRCLVHVSEQESVNNPYAVCAKSVGTTSNKCSGSFDYEKFDKKELKGYNKLKGINSKGKKDDLIKSLKKWKKEKYGN